MSKLSIHYRPTSELIPYARNSRTHSQDQVQQIASSIKEFGFTNPVLIDEQSTIIAGHGRVMAANKLGLQEVPTITLAGLTETQRKAYIIADNRIALNAGWDDEMLRLEIADLKEVDFDLDLLGFDDEEIAALEVEEVEGQTDPDDVPEPTADPVSVLGDIWTLGNHRLMCGDSTSIDAVNKLMDGQKADMVFTDPPYGMNAVSKDGRVGGDTKNAKAQIYSPVIGDESTETAQESYHLLISLKPKVKIIWGGNYFTDFLPPTACWIVWDKQRPEGLTFADGEMAWTDQTTPLKFFRHKWDGYHRASEKDQKRVHPTQKPVALAEWCFDEYGKECSSVIDLFGGSGSTLLACEKKGKRGFLMELSPDYCDVIVKRWQDFTGKKAVHESGKTFDEMASSRRK